MKKSETTMLGWLLVFVGFVLMIFINACSPVKQKTNDTYGVMFSETNWFQDNVPYDKVLSLMENPQEDMIVYCNGKVFMTIVE